MSDTEDIIMSASVITQSFNIGRTSSISSMLPYYAMSLRGASAHSLFALPLTENREVAAVRGSDSVLKTISSQIGVAARRVAKGTLAHCDLEGKGERVRDTYSYPVFGR